MIRQLLFWLTQACAAVLMAVFIVALFYPQVQLADPRLALGYLSVLVLYVLVKEIGRWLAPAPALGLWKGHTWVVGWVLLGLAGYFTGRPQGLTAIASVVVGLYLLSRLSKVLAPLPGQPLVLPKPEPAQAQPAAPTRAAAAAPKTASARKIAPSAARDSILKLLKGKAQGLSCTEVTDATGMAYRTAFRHLDTLVIQRKVKQSGAARATRYTLR
jgi:hypothetical protein